MAWTSTRGQGTKWGEAPPGGGVGPPPAQKEKSLRESGKINGSKQNARKYVKKNSKHPTSRRTGEIFFVPGGSWTPLCKTNAHLEPCSGVVVDLLFLVVALCLGSLEGGLLLLLMKWTASIRPPQRTFHSRNNIWLAEVHRQGGGDTKKAATAHRGGGDYLEVIYLAKNSGILG